MGPGGGRPSSTQGLGQEQSAQARPSRAQRADTAAWGASSQLAVWEPLREAPPGDSGHSDNRLNSKSGNISGQQGGQLTSLP